MSRTEQGRQRSPSKDGSIATVSQCLSDGRLVELLHDPVQQLTAFALWKNDNWTIENSVIAPTGERLVPFSPKNNIIQNNVVLLPSEPAEFGNKEELLAEITRYLHRYLDLDEGFV